MIFVNKLKTLVAGFNLIGVDLNGYTELLQEARQEAMDRLAQQAEGVGANAVLNVRFTTSSVVQRRLRRFPKNLIPFCLSARPSSALQQQLHRSTMRLLLRIEDEQESGAIWYGISRQSPKLLADGAAVGLD